MKILSTNQASETPGDFLIEIRIKSKVLAAGEQGCPNCQQLSKVGFEAAKLQLKRQHGNQKMKIILKCSNQLFCFRFYLLAKTFIHTKMHVIN